MAGSHRSEPRLLRLRFGDTGFPLDADKLIIGRSRSCDLRLRDDTVSRLHAAFVWRAGTLVLEDMGSANGTFLNGERVLEPCPVKAGDDVRFGSLTGTLERSETAAGSQSTAVTGAHQVVAFPVRPAGLGLRLLAALADLTLFAAGTLGASAPVLAERYLPAGADGLRPVLSGAAGALWVLFAFYYLIHGWARRSGTLGLRMFGLRLLDWRQRTPIGYPRALLRLAALLVTFLTLGLGFLSVPFRRDRKALHDVLAGTLVTRRPPPFGRAAGSA